MRFRGAASVVAVCEFCRSTLVREGAKLEDIGKQADLLDDASPLQLGAQGRHRGAEFLVVGRIQYRYQAGSWNEWHVLFPGGNSAWLSDADGKYRVSYLRPPLTVPAFADLKPGAILSLQGEPFEVMDLESAEVVSGEGELPFKFLGGWTAPVADLRGSGTHFATLDYSEEPPRLYLGEELPFDSFRFAGLRDPRVARAGPKARALRCPNCAAPLEKRLATTQTIGCPNCGAALDATKDDLAILAKHAAHTKMQPTIPLGSRAKFGGAEYEVVGYLRRASVVDGVTYEWAEYLLHNVEHGYLWLTEYRGHFNMVRACTDRPKPVAALGPPQLEYLGRRFRHFQNSQPRVTYLVGEFNWRVQLGDVCQLSEYVAPPLSLSCEKTGNEVNWSLAEYLDGAQLWKAFRLKGTAPQPVGIYANQPSPHDGRAGRYLSLSLKVLLVAALIHVVLALTTDSRVLQRLELATRPYQVARAASEVFELRGFRPVRLAIAAESQALAAGEIELDYTLVNAVDGQAWELGAAVWNVSGVDDGEAWHDSQLKSVAYVSRLPPGRYTLAARASHVPAGPAAAPASTSIRVYRTSPDWTNLAILAGLLLLAPLIAWWRSRSFEQARWAESDYAAEDADSDDSDE